MKIIFCGYRTWAIEVLHGLKKQFPKNEFLLLQNQIEFKSNIDHIKKSDLVICCGWSWILPREVVNSVFTVGIHPSDLPNYAGGSPIQHQIIDGLKSTKVSLFRLTAELDEGPVLSKLDFDLNGHINEIFNRLSSVSIALFNDLISRIDYYKNHEFLVPQKYEYKTRKRLLPQDSELTIEKFSKMSCAKLFDFIRCREDPYPNVYIQDETGKLLIKWVEFEPKK